MRFSQWVYERPDYTELKKRIRDAASYEELHRVFFETGKLSGKPLNPGKTQ